MAKWKVIYYNARVYKIMFILMVLLSFMNLAFAEALKQDLPNFAEVKSNMLYRGGRPTEAGLETLRSVYHVKTIINLQGGDLNSWLRPLVEKLEKGELPENIQAEGEKATSLGMNYLKYPLDSIDAITADENREINEILEKLQDPALQPIYVHCEHGKDRTGLIIALERVEIEHKSVQEAELEWEALGHTETSQIFTGALDRYFKRRMRNESKQ